MCTSLLLKSRPFQSMAAIILSVTLVPGCVQTVKPVAETSPEKRPIETLHMAPPKETAKPAVAQAQSKIKTPEELHAALKAVNPKYNGQGKFKDVDGKIVEIDLRSTGATNIAPLTGLPLTRFRIQGTEIPDISPLAGMRLTNVGLGGTGIRDISPLKGMPLTTLFLGGTRTSDLSPLKGMSLTSLDIHFTGVSDLSPLRGMALTHFGADICKSLTDMSPLKGMPLRTVSFINTPVTDLTALEGMPLEELILPPKVEKGMDIVRGIKTLKVIATSQDVMDNRTVEGYELTTAEQFWKRYDAGEFDKFLEKVPVGAEANPPIRK